MASAAQIAIPAPCVESWSTMTAVAGGRHCAMCQKTVQDFSAYTDRELADWLMRHDGKATCGRFRVDQLERPIGQVRSVPRGIGGWVRWAVALVLGWQTANGQSTPSGQRANPALPPLVASSLRHLPLQPTTPKPTSARPALFYITGRVTDSLGVPLPGLHVTYQSVYRGCETNTEGYFQLAVDETDQKAKFRTLTFSYVGFLTQSITISTQQAQPPIHVVMKESQLTLLGEVVIAPAPRSSNQFKQTWDAVKRLVR
ncbi:carboxypeptidase-like regulatory domain-containing protein [Fibrella sp. WM1]|uniref:carboxypeptidase-like regulatory domain-containing protein n=1 Tax=Fibrella musci TaxID=3242485 RepID=UPI003520A151